MNKILHLSIMLMITSLTFGQNVGIGTNTPDASSKLDINSTNSGLLVPRVALTSTSDGTTPILSPATSLLVYNTATINDVTPGYYYWNGSNWVKLLASNTVTGWLTTGNSGTNPASNFLGTIDNTDLTIRTNNTIASIFKVNRAIWTKMTNQNTAIGDSTGFALTSGGSNTFIGFNAGSSNTTASNNTFVGNQSGAKVTSGGGNAFYGNSSGSKHTSGWYNSFFGHLSGYNNTTSTGNSFFGFWSGLNNTTGNNNTFLGSSCGVLNTSGFYNTFVGVSAGYHGGNGVSNCYFGRQSGEGYGGTNGTNNNSFYGAETGVDIFTGDNNSFFGYSSGHEISSGNSNTFTGDFSGYFTTSGSYNLALGHYALYNNTTGIYNIAIGDSANYNGTTESNNIILGNKTAITGGITNAIGIGNNFTLTNSNTMVVAPSLVLAIGTTSSPAKATIVGTGAAASIPGNTSTGVVRVGIGANDGVDIGKMQVSPFAGWIQVGFNGSITDPLALQPNGGNVGIGLTNPVYRLQLSVDAAAKPGSSIWIIASDRNLKTNIEPFSDGLDILTKIEPVWFNYNGKAGLPTEKRYVGIIAQDVEEVAPYMIGKFRYQIPGTGENRESTGQEEEYLDYDGNAMTYIIINSIKEQQLMISNQQSLIEAQQQKILELQMQVIELNK